MPFPLHLGFAWRIDMDLCHVVLPYDRNHGIDSALEKRNFVLLPYQVQQQSRESLKSADEKIAIFRGIETPVEHFGLFA
jgi:hypothetical protein